MLDCFICVHFDAAILPRRLSVVRFAKPIDEKVDGATAIDMHRHDRQTIKRDWHRQTGSSSFHHPKQLFGKQLNYCPCKKRTCLYKQPLASLAWRSKRVPYHTLNSSRMSAYGTRTLIELKVGIGSALQVQLHLRTCDVEWFNENAVENVSQLLSLISKRILPDEFKDDIENSPMPSTAAKKTVLAKTNDKKRKSTSKTSDKNGKAPGIKFKFTPPIKKTKKTLKKDSDSARAKKKDETKKTYLSTMDTKFLFGDSIQITYRVKPIQNSHRATLSIVKPECSGSSPSPSPTLCQFECLRPLPKLVIIWLYRFDPLNPKQPSMDSTDGFPRPEFVPISSLFKQS